MLNSGSNNATQITPVPGSNHLPPDFGIAPGTGIFRSITMEEIWKPVVGYEGLYDVSIFGNVRSYHSVDGRKVLSIPQKVMIKGRDSCGYLYARLYKAGLKKNHSIHRLVLKSFVGPCPDGNECCHKNNIKTDNRIENLCWGTRKSNCRDYGTQNKGERIGMHKLTNEDILVIRKLGESKYSQRKIAKLFKVSHVNIGSILRRKTWKHLR
jgi:hypothetical protein